MSNAKNKKLVIIALFIFFEKLPYLYNSYNYSFVYLNIINTLVKKSKARATMEFTVIEFKGFNGTDTTIFVSFGYDVSVTLKIPFNATCEAKNDQIEETKKSIIAKSTK